MLYCNILYGEIASQCICHISLVLDTLTPGFYYKVDTFVHGVNEFIDIVN